MSEQTETIIYPSIMFRLHKDYYAVGTKNVAGIMQIPYIEPLPDAPKNVLGIFKFREKVVPVICLRSLFGMQTVEEELAAFEDMMNARRKDHINWVKELDRCAKSGEIFTLVKDPHHCALGQWYDHYEPDDGTMRMHLKKIEEPHRKLHETVQLIEECRKKYQGEELAAQEDRIMQRLTGQYMPQILQVLDGAKEIFREHRRTLLIVIDDGQNAFAVAVDEVLSVEELEDVAPEEQVKKLQGSAYITEIKKSAKMDRMVRMVSDDKLTELAQHYQLDTGKWEG